MSRSTLSDWLLQHVNRQSLEPLYRQLHRLILDAVLAGDLAAGSKLPSSRLLAAELGIARNTVTEVFEHLASEGCLDSRHGSGTYVADLSSERVRGAQDASRGHRAQRVGVTLSQRGRELLAGAGVSTRQWGAFMPGVPDVNEFPARVWARLHSRHWRRASPEQLSYAPGGGLPALREALAEYLRTVRSVQCEPAQIIITTGAHQAVDLAVRLLSDAGERVWVEEPCYWGVRSTLRSLGMKLRPVPVDAEGICWEGLRDVKPPRLILATPSHQYPLGMVMSLARRRGLLSFCHRYGSWIIEDDYDSEFRYGSRPIACLQGLDSGERVLYVGSFSKTLFPGLRVGYMVVPPDLSEAFSKASAELYREGQLQQQAMLADFITEGHLASHIRRMRGLYARRRQCLLEAVHREFNPPLPVSGENAGLHLVLHMPHGIDDVQITAEALQAGIAVRPLSKYFSRPAQAAPGLLLGYACVNETEIPVAFARLAVVLRRHLSRAKTPTRAAGTGRCARHRSRAR